MERLPFDPQRVVGASPPAPPPSGAKAGGDGAGRLTVSQLAALIESTLRQSMPAKLRVVGEISGFKDGVGGGGGVVGVGGHWYFSLKDAGAVIGCVMFQSVAKKVGFTPTNGQEVVVTGRIEFWGKGGRTQFYAEKIEPVGAGALDLQFRKLVEELRALGWMDSARKRPIPSFPRRVAVVTSRAGAAVHDVLDTMRRRCSAIDVAIVDVRVQGDGAAADVAGALRWLSSVHAAEGIDVIVLTRGGGSKEDLWTFNERAVAEAIVRSPIPVVAAIGHEVDVTIAELVADERAATPTQAAMRVTPDRAALTEQLDSLGGRLASSLVRLCRHDRERLRSAARHPFFTDPRALVRTGGERLAAVERHLGSAAESSLARRRSTLEWFSAAIERHRPAAVYARRTADLARVAASLQAAITSRLQREDLGPLDSRLLGSLGQAVTRRADALAAAERALELVGPVSVLRRGYSCTLAADGSVVRSIADVRDGQPLRTRVLDGMFDSVVQGGVSEQGAVPERLRTAVAPGSRRKPRRGQSSNPNQMDLFGSS